MVVVWVWCSQLHRLYFVPFSTRELEHSFWDLGKIGRTGGMVVDENGCDAAEWEKAQHSSQLRCQLRRRVHATLPEDGHLSVPFPIDFTWIVPEDGFETIAAGTRQEPVLGLLPGCSPLSLRGLSSRGRKERRDRWASGEFSCR